MKPLTILLTIIAVTLTAVLIDMLDERRQIEIPPVNIYVQAPAAGQDAYTVLYDCDQHNEVDLLLPDLQDKVKAILLELSGYWNVWETKRGLCRQTKLMQKGVTPRMDSKHLIGAAVDFACWDKETGKASWDCEWSTLGNICKRHGLIWGGDFPTLNDPGHCELPPLQPL